MIKILAEKKLVDTLMRTDNTLNVNAMKSTFSLKGFTTVDQWTCMHLIFLEWMKSFSGIQNNTLVMFC